MPNFLFLLVEDAGVDALVALTLCVQAPQAPEVVLFWALSFVRVAAAFLASALRARVCLPLWSLRDCCVVGEMPGLLRSLVVVNEDRLRAGSNAVACVKKAWDNVLKEVIDRMAACPHQRVRAFRQQVYEHMSNLGWQYPEPTAEILDAVDQKVSDQFAAWSRPQDQVAAAAVLDADLPALGGH